MSDLNRTIHANEQIGTAVRDWVADLPIDELKFHSYIAFQVALSMPTCPMGMYAGLAAVKLMELIEQKEREEAAK